VRVRKHLKLWYPLSPTAPIEGGRKPADFVPPFEILDGERLHQWIGARYARDGGVGTHFDRIRRQQLLLRALLKMGFAFSRVLRDPPCLLCQASELSRTHIWFADGGTSLALDNLKIGQLPAWKCLWFDLDVYILERAGDHKELRDFVGQPVAINLSCCHPDRGNRFSGWEIAPDRRIGGSAAVSHRPDVNRARRGASVLG
jgi:hypothetical protein